MIDRETETGATPATPDYDQFAENAAILQSLSSGELESCPHFWQFQLNANHTLVRGCVHCGQADATLVMGSPDDLQWHRIQEPEQGGELAH